MRHDKKLDTTALINEIKKSKQITNTKITRATKRKAIKKVKDLPQSPASQGIKNKLNITKSIKNNLYNANRLGKATVNLNQIATSRPQKDLLQKILRKHNINEDSVATTLLTLKDDPDYRAREAYIDKTIKYLGYEFTEKGTDGTGQTNNIVIMPAEIVKKFKKDRIGDDDNDIIEVE